MRALRWMAALALMAATAAPVEAQPNAEQDLQIGDADTFRRALADLRERMLRPGERVADWDRGGANPDADLRAAGAEDHFFLNRGDDGTSVGILTSRPLSDFAPAGWRVVDSYGSAAVRLPAPQLDFVPLSARYVFTSRGQYRRRGDIDCTAGITNALLYEVPGAAASPDDEAIPTMFRMLILAMDGQEICVRSDGDAARGYRSRTFLPDGRPLPELTGESVTTIVPAAPIDRLIAPPAPPPPPTS
jgi:hypothetical protein